MSAVVCKYRFYLHSALYICVHRQLDAHSCIHTQRCDSNMSVECSAPHVMHVFASGACMHTYIHVIDVYTDAAPLRLFHDSFRAQRCTCVRKCIHAYTLTDMNALIHASMCMSAGTRRHGCCSGLGQHPRFDTPCSYICMYVHTRRGQTRISTRFLSWSSASYVYAQTHANISIRMYTRTCMPSCSCVYTCMPSCM